MYGVNRETQNWDLMLDGTIDSIMEMPENEELNTDDWLNSEKETADKLVTSMMEMVVEMELDMKQCQSSLKECIDQIELLKSGSAWWMNQLDLLHHSIIHDPDMEVNSGRSIGGGDQHVTNKSKQCNNPSLLARPEKRGDMSDRHGGSLFLASIQGLDDGGRDILNRIDLLKNKNAFVSSGNREPFRSLIMSPPSSLATVRGGTKEEETSDIRAKSVQQLTGQVKLPETLEATSPLETDEQW